MGHIIIINNVRITVEMSCENLVAEFYVLAVKKYKFYSFSGVWGFTLTGAY